MILIAKCDREIRLWADGFSYLIKSTQIVQEIIKDNKEREKTKMDQFQALSKTEK